MMSIASLIFLIATVATATAVDDNNSNNKKISNGEQECYNDHFKENMQIIIQRELGTDNSISDFDIEIKDGQVCVYMNDNLDERKSDISQPAPMRDENNNNNNNCNDLSTCVHLGEGDNKIGDINIDVS